jgi:hypothetical protein
MFPERSPENNVCGVAPFLFFQYIGVCVTHAVGTKNARFCDG